MKILVTGATGFIGSALVNYLSNNGKYEIIGICRTFQSQQSRDIKTYAIGDLASLPDISHLLNSVNVIIHAAARVHVLGDSGEENIQHYRLVNVESTLNLAEQAANAGVKRFIYISSVKVNGEETLPDKPFTELDRPAPHDAYGVSKLEAEEGLRSLAKRTGLDVVIVRPPLVYGPGVKGNFRKLVRWVKSGVPLPLGAIKNKRSLIALDNLMDLLEICIDHPQAKSQTFLAADGEDLSSPELLRRVAKAMERETPIFPIPVSIIKLGAIVLGKKTMAQRLCSNLQVDISKAKEILGWTPPISVNEGLKGVFKKNEQR